MSVIDRWHELVKTKDLRALDAILADDAVFESPVVHTPQVGKALTLMYLTGALHTLNNETFRYLNEWHGDRSTVLEFACEIDGITVNGVDLITWNEAGKITHFKVMIRPLKAINLLHRLMGERLAKA